VACCGARERKRRVIALTGHGGKTAIAEHVRRVHGFEIVRMRSPVFVACANLTGLDERSFFDGRKRDVDIRVNDTPANVADFVENLLQKRLFGGEFLTHLFELRMRETKRDVIVPDIRFDAEADFLKKRYNAVIVKLHCENSHVYEFLLNDSTGVSAGLVDCHVDAKSPVEAVAAYERIGLH
jgi:hypothetical protein